MESKSKLGYLGLGLMGSQMTRRLIQNGYQVTGFDPDSNKVNEAVANGVVAAASPAEVARASDIVLACVINTTALTEAIFGPDGIVESDVRDKIFLDHSTTIADKTRELAARLREKTGMRWVDAPVSGGPPAAGTGKLAIMVGGNDCDVSQIQPVLDACDRQGVPAYLENSNPANTGFYSACGFAPLGDPIHPEPGSPPLVPMVRQPRRS